MIDTWKLVVLERYAKFDGRAGRAEYWWFVLANWLAWIALGILTGIGFAIADAIGILFLIVLIGYWLALIVPSVAVAVRRLHDTDKSGWLLLLVFIPLVGWIASIVLLVFMIIEGDKGPNKFGAAAEPSA